jgi:hypothetical protein
MISASVRLVAGRLVAGNVAWKTAVLRVTVVLLAAVASYVAFTPPAAGREPLFKPPCGTAGGETFTGADVGCGPRYCGAKHDSYGCDPCDAANRWFGCDGARQLPETLAPWQRPPGRGFETPTVPCGRNLSPCDGVPGGSIAGCGKCAGEASHGPRWATLFGRPLWLAD